MRRNQRRVGPLSRLEPMKKCASISCLTPRRSGGGSAIHEKFKRDANQEEKPEGKPDDPLLFPLIGNKLPE